MTLDHRKLDGMYALGLPEGPTLEDLLELNSRFFGWRVMEVSETTVFGVPALSARVRGREGSSISLMGLVGDEAFLLSLNAPHEDGLDGFKPVWARMLDSVRPAEVAMTVEQGYFKEAREAQDLANLKFARVGAVLRQTYPVRELVIQALTEAGVGTAFTATVEALEAIDPPNQYEAGHRQLVEVHRELARLDAQMGEAVEAEDLLSFSPNPPKEGVGLAS